MRFLALAALAASLLAPLPVQALALGAVELQAARNLGCVLAEDALGYLSEDEFNDRFDAAVADAPEGQVDVIYAKALGYIDGLLFGVAPGQREEALRRLEAYSLSGACTRAVSDRMVI